MADSVAGVVLAAGAGTRLHPLTRLRPKALCPLGDRPLVDHALERFDAVTSSIAVNVHFHRDLLESHLAGRVHLSFERARPLGTGGALGHLHDWIDGRPVLLVNADTWCPAPVDALLDGWDGTRIRIQVAGAARFAAGVTVAAALLPWRDVATLPDEPCGITPTWFRADAEGRVETLRLDDAVPCMDCGTPRAYLDANLEWSGGESVVGRGATVDGEIDRCVLWPGAVVHAGERLERAIRAHEHLTVLVR